MPQTLNIEIDPEDYERVKSQLERLYRIADNTSFRVEKYSEIIANLSYIWVVIGTAIGFVGGAIVMYLIVGMR
jgi:hypothetical protein